MILENGIVRTLDRSLPEARALAIAGDRVAGGVGVHETALASPDVVDLGGRCVLPGFTDSHVHFPTWAISQHEVKLDRCASLDDALERIRAAEPRGGWLRGYGWRDADWPGSRAPVKEDLDAIAGDRPAAMISKDYHSLWLSSAALALAGGDLEVDGGVVERDERGEPTGVLREEAAWRFKERHMEIPAREYVDAMRTGVKLANTRGVTCVNDKDGWLGA
ncbi:MAG TPA: amidohydrolase family protein, partial [Nannocystaceae bacterium]|nr:amidohydrolase family protein [Nannocystaceae bacterium]